MIRSRTYSKTPKSKISDSSIHRERRYSNFKKNYELRQKECEYSRDALETSYERAIDNTLFGMDSFYLTLGTTKTTSSANRRSSSATRSYSNKSSNKYRSTNISSNTNVYSQYPRASPKMNLYSQYNYYESPRNSIFSQKNYESPRTISYSRNNYESPKTSLYSKYPNTSTSRQYFKLHSHNSKDIVLQSGSPIFGLESPFSLNKSKNATSNANQNVEIQEEEEEIENQENNIKNQEEEEEEQFQSPSKSTKLTKVSNTNGKISGKQSSIKSSNAGKSQNQPAKIKTEEFETPNAQSRKNSLSKANSPTPNNSRSNENPPTSNNSRSKSSKESPNNNSKNNSKNNSNSGSPTGSGIGAHLYSFSYANQNKSANIKEKYDIHTSVDFESDKENKSDSFSEMMPELHASELESTPHGSFNEEEEEEVEINSNDIINNDDNEENLEEEEMVQFKINSDDAENENIIPNENANHNQRSTNAEGIEFNKQLNTVAQNLQSISSNFKTGSSSNPHSEMNNSNNYSNEEVKMITTPNRTDSTKLKNKSLPQQDKEVSYAHSASSDFSPIIYGKNQSENNSEDSELLSTDGIPKPNIGSPKAKKQQG